MSEAKNAAKQEKVEKSADKTTAGKITDAKQFRDAKGVLLKLPKTAFASVALKVAYFGEAVRERYARKIKALELKRDAILDRLAEQKADAEGNADPKAKLARKIARLQARLEKMKTE